MFNDIGTKTDGVRGQARTAKTKKGGVKAVSIRTRQQEVQGWPHSVSDIELETEVQIQFLTNGHHTLIVQRGVGVW